jgi:hypothetical protein
MALPIFKDNNQVFQLMQKSWSSVLNVLLGNPSLQSSILENISLINGANIINHKLGRKLQGWRITRLRTPGAIIFDTQDSNTMPELTLLLTSNAACVVNIEVF